MEHLFNRPNVSTKSSSSEAQGSTVYAGIPLLYTSVGILTLILNEFANQEQGRERPPDQYLYRSILLRDVNSLNFSSPTIYNKSKVIVVVSTRPSDTSIRHAIRQTWANPLFSEAVSNKTVSVLFVTGTHRVTAPFIDELRKYNDVLQVNLPDTYPSLVYKILAAYRWIAANYPDKFVLKVDHDVVLLLDKVIAHLRKPNEECILCYVLQNVKPEREANNPWYIPESAYSEQYLPDYCNGPTYLMTPAALAALMKAAEKAKVFEVEDAFFTGVLASLAGVQRMKLRGIWNRVKWSQPCINGNGTVISYPVHYAGPRDLLEHWYILRSLRCRYPIEDLLMSLILRD